MFHREVGFAAVHPAVCADLAVAGEQAVFAQSHVPAAGVAVAAADHDDGTADHAGPLAGDFLEPARHGKARIAQVVYDLAGSVVSGGARQRCPSHRLSVGVDDQNAGGCL